MAESTSDAGQSTRHWRRATLGATIALGASFALAAPPAGAATPPPARAAAVTASPGDVDYNTWQRDCQIVMDRAMAYMQERVANAEAGERQAIVLDIDNTALETDLGFAIPQSANEPVLEVAQYAEEHGVDLMFVTARPSILYLPTLWNLDLAGYESSVLYVRSVPELFEDVADYKTAQRVDIESNGYTIIANIGNNTTDLSGGHAERTFKLPDYDGQLS